MWSPPDELTGFLREEHPHAAGLTRWVLDRAISAEPDLQPRVYRGWNGVGLRHPEAGLVAAAYPQPGGEVRLQFEHGVRLEDPDGVLAGAGRQTRYLEVREHTRQTAAVIADLVHAAVAERLFRR